LPKREEISSLGINSSLLDEKLNKDVENENKDKDKKEEESFITKLLSKIFFNNSVGQHLFPALKVFSNF